MLGLHFRNDVSENVLQNSHKITGFSIHEEYNQNTTENDIALLQLDKEVTFNEQILAICLPDSESDYLNRDALITGWGSNSANSVQLQV